MGRRDRGWRGQPAEAARRGPMMAAEAAPRPDRWPPRAGERRPPPPPMARAAAATPDDVRTDFNPLAVFAPAVTTDAEGRPGRGSSARQPHPLPCHGRRRHREGVRQGRGDAYRPPAADGARPRAPRLPQLRRPL